MVENWLPTCSLPSPSPQRPLVRAASVRRLATAKSARTIRRYGVIRFQHRRKISSILIQNTLAPIAIRTAPGSCLVIEGVKPRTTITRSRYGQHSLGLSKKVRTAVGRQICAAGTRTLVPKERARKAGSTVRCARQSQKESPPAQPDRLEICPSGLSAGARQLVRKIAATPARKPGGAPATLICGTPLDIPGMAQRVMRSNGSTLPRSPCCCPRPDGDPGNRFICAPGFNSAPSSIGQAGNDNRASRPSARDSSRMRDACGRGPNRVPFPLF
jgi:hypothetical protein